MNLRKSVFCKGVSALLFCSIATPVFSADFVYQVSNSTQLIDALLTIEQESTEINVDDRHIIKLRPGVYKGSFSLPINAPNFTEKYTVEISGGWDSSFSQRSNNPDDTILDGQVDSTHKYSIFSISIGSTATPEITLKNLTFKNGHLSNGTSALSVSVTGSAQPFIRLDRLIFKYNGTPLSNLQPANSTVQFGTLGTGAPTIALMNSQLLDNESGNQPALSIISNGGAAKFYILNNTIVGNYLTGNLSTSAGLNASSPTANADELYLYNNIIQGNLDAQNNPTRDVNTTSPFQTSQSYHNHIGINFGVFTTTVRESSGRAILATGPSPPSFYWVPRSCFLINSGTAWPAPFNILSPASLDLLGAPRVRGSGVDRGAVELDMTDFIFCSDFEAN